MGSRGRSWGAIQLLAFGNLPGSTGALLGHMGTISCSLGPHWDCFGTHRGAEEHSLTQEKALKQ